jgi:plastocyanin domain-containing protein
VEQLALRAATRRWSVTRFPSEHPSPSRLTRLAWLSAIALACAGCAGSATQAQSGTIQMKVTEAGYEPDRIKVKQGSPVKLVITRTTDATCAKEIVIDEHKIHTKLPLNTPVTVSFTPTKSGELKYGCAMDKMIFGVLVIE